VIVLGVCLLAVLLLFQFVTVGEQLSVTKFVHAQSLLTDKGASFRNSLEGSFAVVDQDGKPVVVSRLKGFGFFGSEPDSPRVDRLVFSGSVSTLGQDVDWGTFQISGSFKVKMDVSQPPGLGKETSSYPLALKTVRRSDGGPPVECWFQGDFGLADFDSHMKMAAFSGYMFPNSVKPVSADVLFTVTVTLTASVKDRYWNALTAERIISASLLLRWRYEQTGSAFGISAKMAMGSLTTSTTPITVTWTGTWPTDSYTYVTATTVWTTKTSLTSTTTFTTERDERGYREFSLFRISIIDIRRIS